MVLTVLLLCGPPACGKSELVRLLRSRIPKSTSIIFDEVFSFDEQRKAVHEENGFKDLRERFLEAGKQIFEHETGPSHEDQPESGEERSCRLIIVEDNFYRRSMRYKWFQEARERGLSFCTVFFATPIEDCLQRNRQRAQPVPEAVIREQFSKLEPPDSDENFWEKFSLVEPFPTVEAVSALISAAEKSPFERLDVERQCEELEQARRETKDSKLHQIDLGFRKAVSVLIKEAAPMGRNEAYARLNTLKQSVISSEEIIACRLEDIDAHILSELRKRLQRDE